MVFRRIIAKHETTKVTLTSMAEEQGNSVRHSALFVHIVDIQRPETVDVDVSREHGQLVIEFLLVLAPVVPILPSFRESFDISKRNTVFPVGVLEFVRKGGEFELPVKEIKFFVRDSDREWRLCHRRDDPKIRDWDG